MGRGEVVVITHCALESFQTLSGYQSWSWRELGELEDQLYLELKLWKRLKQNLWAVPAGTFLIGALANLALVYIEYTRKSNQCWFCIYLLDNSFNVKMVRSGLVWSSPVWCNLVWSCLARITWSLIYPPSFSKYLPPSHLRAKYFPSPNIFLLFLLCFCSPQW